MPPLNVAPIYTDAFVKTVYEGMAIIVEENLHSVETTLLGVTCRLYWVRFFYTEINLLRWVEVSSIETWSDPIRRSIPIASVVGGGTWSNYDTELRFIIDSVGGTNAYSYFCMPDLSLEDIILSFGILFSIAVGAHADSFVKLLLLNQPNTTPNTACLTLDSCISYSQSNTYAALAKTLGTPFSVLSSSSLCLHLQTYQKKNVTAGLYIYVKSVYVDIVRLI